MSLGGPVPAYLQSTSHEPGRQVQNAKGGLVMSVTQCHNATMKMVLVVIFGFSLTGCNVVPPLDCLLGVNRPGCQRNDQGEYGYLYRSPLTPNGKYDVPMTQFYTAPQNNYPVPYYIPPQPALPVQTTCYRFGNSVNCNSY